MLFFCNRSEIVYFDSFRVEHVSEEIKNFIENKSIKANIFGVQANNSIMCGYYCIGFIYFMLQGKKLTDFTSLFSPCDFEKNDDIILSCFKDEWNWQNELARTDKISAKWNNRNWKLFSSRDQSIEIMDQKIKQVCYSLWLHRQDFNCFKRNNRCSIRHFFY